MSNNMGVDIKMSAKGRKKLDNTTYSNIMKNAINTLTHDALAGCMKEAPVAQTGNLRKSHTAYFDDDGLSGHIKNNIHYASKIIWGVGTPYEGEEDNASGTKGAAYEIDGKTYTSGGIPNNYPQRVVNEMATNKKGQQAIRTAMQKYGVKS